MLTDEQIIEDFLFDPYLKPGADDEILRPEP